MVFPRRIYPSLLAHAQTPLVTVLTGMRRTGKTTLIKKLLIDIPNKNSLYLDLQRPDNREIFEQKNYEAIYETFMARGLSAAESMVVALDETQLAPHAPSAIKYLYDHHQVKFIVTGSSSYYLKNLFTESLSGRKKIFELYPLDFGEFLTFKEIKFSFKDWQNKPFDKLEYDRLKTYYEEYIRFGGFPQVVLAASDEEKRDLLLDIMSSYVNIDIRSLADFSDERNLYKLAKLLVGRIGSRVEYTTLSRLTGLSRQTVNNYVTFFEKTYLVSTIPVLTKSPTREIVKARKLFFCDTGLANSLGDLSGGAQFENTLFNQLSRIGSLQYYALKSGNEIDFILNGELALEAKETPTEGDLASLLRMAARAGLSKNRIIGRNQSPKFDDYAWGGSIV
ncbi:MAG: ATPase [Microgenomates group bacterium GW2011_GWA1_Microgenomates_45_10]|nr:MAG: ATPase [Microgenomates group bacterium GW2011_GWA2_44_7]KKT77934.1 MAG: ATPase [Microgenomates group bacterium GW2011_GWB1_44_8]KKT86929.1 MAG: ATPase [Microgenomates group bacterium GW2011_GWA1_Microgenomates_45_10]